MKVIIAEKPSLARNIVQAIDSKMKRMDGYYIGDEYIVTYAFGHLFKLYDVEMYRPDYDASRKYLWNETPLPFFPSEFKFSLQKEEGIIKQYKIIRNLINDERVDEIINAGDSDREGEIIVRIIISYALKSPKKINRLWMPDQTSKTILSELREMRSDESYNGLANEGYARTYVDWLYGINLSRFTSLKTHSLFRVGRVIAPIVKAIYEREMQIVNFVEEDYFVLKSKEMTNGEVMELVSKEEFKLSDIDRLEKTLESYNNDKARVINVTSEEKIIPSEKLFSLSKLQGELGKKYKMSLDKSLNILQNLYEKGYVSYPRTPSQYLAENEKDKFKEIIQNFVNKGVNIVFKNTKKIFDDSKIESHSALTPTYKIPSKKDLSEDEIKVYEMICHRFFAVFCKEDLKVLRSNIEIELENNKEVFKVNGDIVINQGWLVFENKEKKDKILPKLNKGDYVNINFKKISKKTKPLPRYTTETLNNFLKNPFKDNLKKIKDNEDEDEISELKAMFEGVELGTEATRSAIIENAIKSSYISLKDNVYHLESLGKYYVETLEELNLMMDKEKTASIGRNLKRVYRNEISIDECIYEVEKEIKDLIANVNENYMVKRAPRVFEVEESKRLCKCPKCGNYIAITDYGYRCSNSGCALTLTKDNKLFEKIGKKVNKETAKKLFTKGFVYYDDLISSKTNKVYKANIVADISEKYMKFKFEFPSEESK